MYNVRCEQATITNSKFEFFAKFLWFTHPKFANFFLVNISLAEKTQHRQIHVQNVISKLYKRAGT